MALGNTRYYLIRELFLLINSKLHKLFPKLADFHFQSWLIFISKVGRYLFPNLAKQEVNLNLLYFSKRRDEMSASVVEAYLYTIFAATKLNSMPQR